MKRRTRQREPDLDASTAETLIWTCSACGADNPDSKQKCVSCGGDRAGDTALPRRAQPVAEVESAEPPSQESIEATTVFPKPDSFTSHVEEEEPQPIIPEPEIVPLPQEPAPPEPEISPLQPEPSLFSATPRTLTAEHGRFFMVFVNTPAQSLIKSKVPIEFDDFPVVTIGRSPENVIVIPDQEVSRKHAELTMEGSRLMLKDVNSKNGTFLYNGKEFQQVHDSVEVKPNSIVKFGSGTIVRLTSE